jgi:Transglutaminase-like superfamily
MEQRAPTGEPGAASTAGRFTVPNLRAAWWAFRAARSTERRLRRGGLDGALVLRPPPQLPAEAERGVRAVLRRSEESCLVESIVLQAWHAGQGRRRDLVVGVSPPGEQFRAHAWLAGDVPGPEGRFRELLRRSAP